MSVNLNEKVAIPKSTLLSQRTKHRNQRPYDNFLTKAAVSNNA